MRYDRVDIVAPYQWLVNQAVDWASIIDQEVRGRVPELHTFTRARKFATPTRSRGVARL